jgi:putative transposase
VRYQFIKEQQGQHRVRVLCRVMQVGRGGSYAWLKREPSPREPADQGLTTRIEAVFEESGPTYGSPRICDKLQAEGISCSEKRVARLMRLADLSAVVPKRFVVTIDSNHSLPVADNLLNRHFEAEAPDQKWTSDITSVWTGEGWLYLGGCWTCFLGRWGAGQWQRPWSALWSYRLWRWRTQGTSPGRAWWFMAFGAASTPA